MPIKNGWRRIEKDKGLSKQTIWKHDDVGKIKIFQRDDVWLFEDDEDELTARRTKEEIIKLAEEFKENHPVPPEEYGKHEDTLFAIMIPKRYNNGKKVPKDKIEKLLKPLISRFGGATVDGVDGYWQNPETGEVMEDKNMQVILAREAEDGVPIQDDEQFLRRMADKIGDELGQAEVMIQEETADIEFVRGNFSSSPSDALSN